MTLLEINDQDQWESFQASRPFAQFTQSWAWGEFRGAYGPPVKRFALADGSAWKVAVQMEYRPRRFGVGYWFAPRGPVFADSLGDEEKRRVMWTLCEELLKRRDLQKRILFWRMEPVSELSQPEGLLPLSFRRVPAMNPATTVVVDLAKSEAELLAGMHEKTRYNVRLAEKKGVKIRVASSEKDVEAFLALMNETASRDKFVQHGNEYLKRTYEALKAAGMAQIRLAEFEGKVLGANLEVFYGDTFTYFYGASSSESRNLMAPYLIQWRAMQEAKTRGFTKYDFWGANPATKASFYYKPSWEGISRFKSGWGGRLVSFVGTWDLPFNIYLYRLAFIRQFFRG